MPSYSSNTNVLGTKFLIVKYRSIFQSKFNQAILLVGFASCCSWSASENFLTFCVGTKQHNNFKQKKRKSKREHKRVFVYWPAIKMNKEIEQLCQRAFCDVYHIKHFAMSTPFKMHTFTWGQVFCKWIYIACQIKIFHHSSVCATLPQ